MYFKDATFASVAPMTAPYWSPHQMLNKITDQCSQQLDYNPKNLIYRCNAVMSVQHCLKKEAHLHQLISWEVADLFSSTQINDCSHKEMMFVLLGSTFSFILSMPFEMELLVACAAAMNEIISAGSPKQPLPPTTRRQDEPCTTRGWSLLTCWQTIH